MFLRCLSAVEGRLLLPPEEERGDLLTASGERAVDLELIAIVDLLALRDNASAEVVRFNEPSEAFLADATEAAGEEVDSFEEAVGLVAGLEEEAAADRRLLVLGGAAAGEVKEAEEMVRLLRLTAGTADGDCPPP